MIIIRQMDPDKVTGSDGRWILRHAKLEEGDVPGLDSSMDLHVFLTSERAPKGKSGIELKPETVELIGLESDELKIPVALFQKIIEWPSS